MPSPIHPQFGAVYFRVAERYRMGLMNPSSDWEQYNASPKTKEPLMSQTVTQEVVEQDNKDAISFTLHHPRRQANSGNNTYCRTLDVKITNTGGKDSDTFQSALTADGREIGKTAVGNSKMYGNKAPKTFSLFWEWLLLLNPDYTEMSHLRKGN